MILPEHNAEFVACMEDVLEVYHRPYDPQRPVICLDEQPTQLIGETRTPIPLQPGQPQRYDYDYERIGTANNFMIVEPLAARSASAPTKPHAISRMRSRNCWTSITTGLKRLF